MVFHADDDVPKVEGTFHEIYHLHPHLALLSLKDDIEIFWVVHNNNKEEDEYEDENTIVLELHSRFARDIFCIPLELCIYVLSLLIERIRNNTLRAITLSIPSFLWSVELEALMKNPNSPIFLLDLDSRISSKLDIIPDSGIPPELQSTLNQIMDTNTCRLIYLQYESASLEGIRRRMRFEARQEKLIPLQKCMFALLSARFSPSSVKRLPIELVRMLSGFFI